MNLLTSTVARIIYAVPLAVFGLMHLTSGKAMAGMVPVPGGVFWVYFTGLALIAAAVSIIIQKMSYWACLGLALLLALFALTIHMPGLPNPSSMGNFLKDLSLAGAALYLAGALKK